MKTLRLIVRQGLPQTLKTFQNIAWILNIMGCLTISAMKIFSFLKYFDYEFRNLAYKSNRKAFCLSKKIKNEKI
jgi:hypothetical protein